MLFIVTYHPLDCVTSSIEGLNYLAVAEENVTLQLHRVHVHGRDGGRVNSGFPLCLSKPLWYIYQPLPGERMGLLSIIAVACHAYMVQK